MKFDPTITLGVIVHLVVLLGGVVGAYWTLQIRIDRGLTKVEKCLHALHAENSARLDVVESRLSDLWHHFLDRTKGL